METKSSFRLVGFFSCSRVIQHFRFSTRRLAEFYLFSFSVYIVFFVSKMFLIKSFGCNVHMQRTLPHHV